MRERASSICGTISSPFPRNQLVFFTLSKRSRNSFGHSDGDGDGEVVNPPARRRSEGQEISTVPRPSEKRMPPLATVLSSSARTVRFTLMGAGRMLGRWRTCCAHPSACRRAVMILGLLVIVVLRVVVVIGMYNELVGLEVHGDNACADIEVQL